MFPGWEIKPILIQLKEKREERRRRIFRWPLAMHYTRNTNQLKSPWLAKDNDDQHSIDRYSLRSSSSLNSATKVEALSTCPLLVLISNPVFRWWNDIRMLCSFDFTAFSSSSNCTLGYIPSMLLPSNDRRTTPPTATSLLPSQSDTLSRVLLWLAICFIAYYIIVYAKEEQPVEDGESNNNNNIVISCFSEKPLLRKAPIFCTSPPPPPPPPLSSCLWWWSWRPRVHQPVHVPVMPFYVIHTPTAPLNLALAD